MINRRNVLVVLLIVSWIIIPISIFLIQSVGSYSIDNIENNVPQLSGDTTFTLEPIIPYPSTDGDIELKWDDATTIIGGASYIRYYVLRETDTGVWERIGDYVTVEYYYIYGLEPGTYVFKILVGCIVNYWPYYMYSNEESIIVQEISPLFGESISINSGATTTDSYEIELSLYCANAEQMSFKLASDTDWTSPEPYITTRYITLPESSVDNPNYTVGVKYIKDTWETEPVYDDINVYIAGQPPPPPPPPEDEFDYTLTFVLVGLLIGLIGIGIFIKLRKKKTTYQRRIKYFEKKDKKRQRKKKS